MDVIIVVTVISISLFVYNLYKREQDIDKTERHIAAVQEKMCKKQK